MRYRFGGFELDTDRLVLLDPAGHEVHLEPRVFDVLRFLLENRARTVTKQELIDGVWAGAFVSDSALKRAVYEARRVLRDHGATAEALKTVHGRGYRFDAPVEIVQAESEAPEPDRPVSPPEGARGVRTTLRGPAARRAPFGALHAGAVVALLVLGAILVWRPWKPGVGAGPEGPPFLAVFPLQNLGPPEAAAFADGLTEEITARLARLDGLDVLSRSSARQYNRSRKTLADVHSDLGVTWVLDGSVRWSHEPDGADRIRVTPQLSSVAGDRVLWTSTFDRPAVEALSIQDDIADEVARQLGGRVSAELHGHGAVDPDAYRAFLSAQAHAGFFTERAQLAASLYQRAVDLDPDFARAWAGLAIAEATLFHRGVDRSAEVAGRAREAAAKALELERDAPEAHRAAGYVRYWIDRDYPAALAAFHRAAELGAADADASADEAYVLRRLGRFDQALEGLRRAARLDPLSGGRRLVIADTLTYVRRYEEADREYQRAIGLEPDLPLAYALRAQNFLLWHGDVAAAAESLGQMPATDEDWALLYRARLLLAAGRADELLALARAQADRVLEVEYGIVPVAELEARAHEAAGDRAFARRAWERAEAALSHAFGERPDDPRAHMARSLARAALGRCDEALAGTAVDAGAAGADGDAFVAGTQLSVVEAEILLRCGERRDAVLRLRRLLEIPSWVSPALLGVDPAWTAVRDDPALLPPAGEQSSARAETSPARD